MTGEVTPMGSRGDPEGEHNTHPMPLRRNASGGGKLSRSETVTVRLDPKLNYLCELAARAQRRTKSSFIEWAVSEALGRVVLPGNMASEGTIASYAERLWDVEEADRLAQMAFQAPVLMTHEEQLIWKLVERNGIMWRGQYLNNEWRWKLEPQQFRWDQYREYFRVFKDVAEGLRPHSDLPEWERTKPEPAAFDTDLDSDIPF